MLHVQVPQDLNISFYIPRGSSEWSSGKGLQIDQFY
jgi:hypothetical protein